MVGEIHAESDTTQAAGALIATAGTFGTKRGSHVPPIKETKPACNARETLVGVYKAPELESYSDK